MKRIVGIVYVFLCWGISLHAQSVRVIETLKKLEMENISVVEKSDTITAAFETSVYRGAYNVSVLPYVIWLLCQKCRLYNWLY